MAGTILSTVEHAPLLDLIINNSEFKQACNLNRGMRDSINLAIARAALDALRSVAANNRDLVCAALDLPPPPPAGTIESRLIALEAHSHKPVDLGPVIQALIERELDDRARYRSAIARQGGA